MLAGASVNRLISHLALYVDKIPSKTKEYNEAEVMAIGLTVLYGIYLGINVAGLQFHAYGKCIDAAIVVFAPSFIFYYTIGVPAYKW